MGSEDCLEKEFVVIPIHHYQQWKPKGMQQHIAPSVETTTTNRSLITKEEDAHN